MSMGKKQNKKPWSKPHTVYQRIASRLSARSKIIKLLEDSMRKIFGPKACGRVFKYATKNIFY